MSDIETIRTQVVDSLLKSSLTSNRSSKLEKLQEQMRNMPSLMDKTTLQKLKDGEYNITLKEYTDMSTYNAKLSALFGNNSASPFQRYLNNILGKNEDKFADAKSFVEKMRENGLSNSSSIKLYSALKSYSLISSIQDYNFVNAKI